jgi:glycosyltransferase involved in cell wall biosynthesis
VCDDLAERARSYDADKPITVLRDVPFEENGPLFPTENLRDHGRPGPIVMYVGNLEQYQGIRLLLEGFARASSQFGASLVIIGGNDGDIARYRTLAAELGIDDRVRFLGRRPVAQLQGFLAQATVLVSPRIRGTNTPMKVYSYMAAGKAVLATDILSHTQVLDSSCALLVAPSPASLGEGIDLLLRDEALRQRLGQAASARARARYSLAAYRKTVIAEYQHLETVALP